MRGCKKHCRRVRLTLCVWGEPHNSFQPRHWAWQELCIILPIMRGGSVAAVTGTCKNIDCWVCSLITNWTGLPSLHICMKWQLSPFIAHHLNSCEAPEDCRQVLVQAFCNLMSCWTTRLANVANVSFLAMLSAHFLYLNLERGWGKCGLIYPKLQQQFVNIKITTAS